MSRIKELIAYKAGKRIQQLIDDKFGGNKSKFGKLLGIDNSGVNKLVDGKRSGLTFYQLYQIRMQCRTDINDLITGEYSDNEEVSEEALRAQYSMAAKKDLHLAHTEIEYLKKGLADKEDIIRSKDQIIEYLKMRLNQFLGD